MELVIKKFDELSLNELYELMSLRVSVFVVEQNCIYQDLDGKDQSSYHLFLRDENGIQACMRIVPEDEGQMLFGRVIAVKRGQGLATKLLASAKSFSKNELGAKSARIIAQLHAVPVYENVGFRQVSDQFIEYGIPRIIMSMDL